MTIVNPYNGSRIDLEACNPGGFVTAGQVQAMIEEKTMGLEDTIAGNVPYPSVAVNEGRRHHKSGCICLRTQTPIDFHRHAHGAAGLVHSKWEPYTWEWRVGKM
jgi:hypothetical protein